METLGTPYDVGLNPTIYQRKYLPHTEKSSYDEVTPLHTSIFFNKVEFIDNLIIDYEINVNHQDTLGNTALMLAGMKGNMAAAKKLIAHNPSTSLVNQHGQSAILMALRYNHPDVALLILNTVNDPTQLMCFTDNSGYTILHYAAYCNDEFLNNFIESNSCVEDMLENTTNPSCSTPLHFAAANGSTKTVSWLLAKGANPTAENCMGQSPLLLAIKKNYKDTINVLLPVSSANVPDNYGQLALHYAAAVGCDVDVLQRILNQFPKALGKMDTNGNYPFHCAVRSNDRKVLDFFFVAEGPSLLVKKNSNGMTPLMLAVACGAQESFGYLTELGSEFYERSMCGTSPFLLACAYGQLEMAKVVFKTDPSVITDVDNSGNTAVHYAVQNNRADIIKWIYETAPEMMNVKNEVGESALHIGCLCGNKNVVEVLRVFGLELSEKTKSGRTGLHYAVLGGHLDVVKLLKKTVGEECYKGDKNKLTPLHYCCAFGMVHLLEEVLSGDVNQLNARDGCGRTPLHVAVVMNDAICVQFLLEKGANLEEVDIRKMSPLSSAINRGYIHCYEIINKCTTFTVIKRVKMVSDYLPDNEKMLQVKSNDVIDVYWESKRGWAIGKLGNKIGLFPLAKSIVVPLEQTDLDKIKEVLANKKMVKKGVDKKNRSASVVSKETQTQAKNTKNAAQVNVNPAALLAMQQLPTQRRAKRTRKAVASVDV
ncbi:hypothetical protein EIN_425060 [Entamoeba invadens IP1]|uniref:SH3 domain-containing protein n=1 Tax=Entamoeba invadens IP1 TaxID=370355 RepID=A0A0A1UBV0_ENTIV|nr:hypothetical protein EIN_425060 [Entamoeba invadens IP1]ELP89784.1 hypothetical protein EIN_425060 [Entamoeba invadens IP1]|eukprot:XP_004256555.1 hypothetical protein EIN_425060 [Entamoeba invadens IP1]